jgi:hypothetical protein
VLAVGSVEPGRMGLHVNGGFTRGGLADEWHYRGGTTFSALPQLTIVGELLGRNLDVGRITAARAPHPTIANVDTIRLVTTGSSTNTAGALTGVKWNVDGTWILSGSVTWPLADRGLRSGMVAQIGLDYAWAR